MITEPNFTIFELVSVIPALWFLNRFVSGFDCFQNEVRAEDFRIPYQIVLGIIIGKFGGRITEPIFFNEFGDLFVCKGKGMCQALGFLSATVLVISVV